MKGLILIALACFLMGCAEERAVLGQAESAVFRKPDGSFVFDEETKQKMLAIYGRAPKAATEVGGLIHVTFQSPGEEAFTVAAERFREEASKDMTPAGLIAAAVSALSVGGVLLINRLTKRHTVTVGEPKSAVEVKVAPGP